MKVPLAPTVQNAWHMYKARFSLYLPYYALIALANAGGDIVQFLPKTQVLTPLLSLVLAIILNAISYIGIISLMLALNGDKSKPRAMYQRAINYLAPFYVVSVLQGLAISIGLVLFIFPGILFALWYAFAGFILVLEKSSIGQAFSKSKAYVRHRKGELFLKSLNLGLVVLGLAILILFLPGVLMGLLLANAPEVFKTVITDILALAFVTVVSPLTVIYNYLLYLQFKK